MPFLSLDGTHARNGYKQIILLAIGRDCNNESILYAWALVETESTATWTWFLTLLEQAVPTLFAKPGLICRPWENNYYPGQPIRNTTISDRQKGLQGSIRTQMPHCNQGYCVFHLCKNIQEDHGGKRCADAFMKLARANTDASYQHRLWDAKEHGGDRFTTWVQAVEPIYWCMKDFPGTAFTALKRYC
jgi:hypothetical protein